MIFEISGSGSGFFESQLRSRPGLQIADSDPQVLKSKILFVRMKSITIHISKSVIKDKVIIQP